MRSRPRVGGVMPEGSLTTIPAVVSAIANSDGVPRRPGSAVTTPRTVTVVPTRRRRAAAIVSPVGDGLGDVGTEGVGDPLDVGVGLEVGAGVGGTVDVGLALGV